MTDKKDGQPKNENSDFESSSSEKQPTAQPKSWMSSLFTAVVGSSSSTSNATTSTTSTTKATPTTSTSDAATAQPDDVSIEKLKEHFEGGETDDEDEASRAKQYEESDKESKQQLWKQVYSYMGSNLSGMRFSLPIRYFEPTTVLTKMAEAFEFSDLLDRAAITNDCVLRDSLVTAFVVSTFSNTSRTRKPLNPILGETYEFLNPVSDMKLYAEQVSHHPPISVSYVQGNDWEASEVINVHGKFQGNSMEVSNSGYRYISLNKFKDYYTWNAPTCSISNIFVGKTNIDYHGSVTITNHYTGNVINLTFPKSGWFGTNQYDVHGHLADKDGNQLLLFKGAWNKYLDSCPVATDEVPPVAPASVKSTADTPGDERIKPKDSSSTGSVKDGTKSARVKIDEVERRERDLRFATSPRKIHRRATKTHVDNRDKNDILSTRGPSSSTCKATLSISPASAPVTPRVVTALPRSIMTGDGDETELSSNAAAKAKHLSSALSAQLAASPSTSSVSSSAAKENDKSNGTGTDGSNRLWVAGSHLLSAEEGGGPNDLFSNFTRFTKRTIAFDNDYATELPPTDSRLRPDRIALENGNLPVAGDEKKRIEQLQRDRRHAAKKIAYKLQREGAFYGSLFSIAQNSMHVASREDELDPNMENEMCHDQHDRRMDDGHGQGEDRDEVESASGFEEEEEDDESEIRDEDRERIKWLLDSQRPKYFRQVDDKGDKWEPLGTYWRDSRSYMDDDEKRMEASMW